MIQSLRYIKTLTGSGVNTIQDSDVFALNDYRNFVVILDKCDISSGTNEVGIRLVDSNGTTLTGNYRYAIRAVNANASSTTAYSASDNRFHKWLGNIINTEQGALAIIKFHYPMAIERTNITIQATQWNNINGYLNGRMFGGTHDLNNRIAGFNIFIDSVTFDEVRCHIYGEK